MTRGRFCVDHSWWWRQFLTSTLAALEKNILEREVWISLRFHISIWLLFVVKERTTCYMSLLKMKQHLDFDILNTDTMYLYIYIYITIVMAIISNTQKTLKQYVWLPNFVFNYLIDIWRCNDVIPLGTSKTCKIHWNNFCSLKFHQGDKLMVWGKVSW